MTKVVVNFFLLLMIHPLIVAAPRGRPKVTSLSHTMKYKHEGTKGEIQAPLSEKDRDYLMFTNFVGIIVNFVKLFMDPNNIPEAKQNAYNILNGINNLAHVITRSGLSKQRQEELIMKIIELCRNCEV